MDRIFEIAKQGGWDEFTTTKEATVSVQEEPILAFFDRKFWMAIGKVCRWDSEDPLWNLPPKTLLVAYRFFEIKFTEGFMSALFYLENLIPDTTYAKFIRVSESEE